MVTLAEAIDQRRTLLRYDNGAILIHWLTVLLVLAQLYIGFTVSDMPRMNIGRPSPIETVSPSVVKIPTVKSSAS